MVADGSIAACRTLGAILAVGSYVKNRSRGIRALLQGEAWEGRLALTIFVDRDGTTAFLDGSERPIIIPIGVA